MINLSFQYIVDATGMVRVYKQHVRSGLDQSAWLMPVPFSWVILYCSGPEQAYEIEREEIGEAANQILCSAIHNLQVQSDTRLRQVEPDSIEAELTRTVGLFVTLLLRLVGKNLLNCSADTQTSLMLRDKLENAVNEILSGSPASVQIELVIPIILEQRCISPINKAA